LRDEALRSKLTALRGKLLKRGDYAGLSRLGSVEAVGEALRNHPGYSAVIASLTAEQLRRVPLERRLIFSVTDDYRGVYRFVTDHQTRRLMDVFFMKYELRIVRTLLGNVFDGRPNDFDPEELGRETSARLGGRLPDLLAAKTLPGFVAALEGTAYYRPLAQAYREGASLFTLETQLELFYYLKLWNAANTRREKKDSELLKLFVGTEIDLKNIMRVYRSKRYYGMDAPRVYACLVPAGYNVHTSELKRVVESKEELPARKYKNVFTGDAGLERGYHAAMSETAARVYSGGADSSALILAYLYYKEREADNLISLIECVRYGLPTDMTMSYLRLPGDGAARNTNGAAN